MDDDAGFLGMALGGHARNSVLRTLLPKRLLNPDARASFAVAIALQVILSIFLAHGYDFRVEYVAGRNIVDGSSPYSGGAVTGWMALGYGPQVQGIGETPLWALYLGLCYFLSSGQPFMFNFLCKIPIVAANMALAYFVRSWGARGWRFFLFNAYLILTSVTWGKPDNLATILAIAALIGTESATSSAFLLSTSLMVKPLAVVILPAFFLRLRTETKQWAAKFVIETSSFSTAMFLGSFIIFGWPLETVTTGSVNWLGHAGALSPFNVLAVAYGTEQLPTGFWWAGYLAPFCILVLAVYAIMRAPQSILRYALLSSAIFLTVRPWNSEQNLVILLTLFIFLREELPSMWLWVIPMLFAIANNSIQQQLYLLRPTIIDELNRLYAPVNTLRLWLRFFLSLAWLAVLWLNVASLFGRKTRSSVLQCRGVSRRFSSPRRPQADARSP
jgi:hypothetical protein